MSEDEKRPSAFEGDGPTIGEALRKCVKVWKNPKFEQIRTALDQTSYLVSALREGENGFGVAAAGMEAATSLIDLILPPEKLFKKASNPVYEKFRDLTAKGHEIYPNEVARALLPLLPPDEVFLIKASEEESQQGELWGYEYQPGCFAYWIEYEDACTSMMCGEDQIQSQEDYHEAQRILGLLFWAENSEYIEVEYDRTRNGFAFSNKDPRLWDYEGDQGRIWIDRWKRFKSAGVRRSIILHGKPGTGKSTLAQQAAREIEGKTAFVKIDTLQNAPMYHFLDFLNGLNPDVLIIDDLDRLGLNKLEILLDFFEESENKIPVVIATTNHLESLPDALKRPGRFDEIWAVSPPKGDVRKKVIRYLADLEGVELSEEAVDRLDELSEERNLPGAHIRELIRRVKVMGEDELNFGEFDLTFTEEWTSNPLPRQIEHYDAWDFDDDYDIEPLTDSLMEDDPYG